MRTLSIGLLAGLLGVTCKAGIITTDPGTGATTIFTATGLTQGPGPVIVNGFSVAGTNVAVGDAPFGLGNNGAWIGFSFLSANSKDTSITINLGASYGLVGGFMNYSTPHDVTGTNPTIQALAADGTTVLETDILSAVAAISTPAGSNTGAFRGITRSQNDIRFLRISGDFILMHTLEVGQAPAAGVPEPGTFGLLLSGLSLVLLGRRQWAIRRS